MDSKLSIRNFKSIKNLDLETKRVNVFIGEPNAGKTNILNALFPFSVNSFDNFKKVLRMEDATNLFYDQNFTAGLNVIYEDYSYSIKQVKNQYGAFLEDLDFSFEIGKNRFSAGLQLNGDLVNQNKLNFGSRFRYYAFDSLVAFENHSFRTFLNPPYGSNLPSLIIQTPYLRQLVSDVFQEKGFKLFARPTSYQIEIAKEINGDIYTYPYQSTSDTLRRIVFLKLAIASNKDSVLVLDEPEANTFPFYTKEIAETIADDTSNTYFLTTHNPYLLKSLIEKTKEKDIQVNLVYMKEYETLVRPFKSDELNELIDVDIFFNLNKYLE